MYKEFYGFSEEPFTLNPNPKFLYLSPSHHEALSAMMSGIKEGKGIVVITGEAGVGKTTLIYALLKDLSKKIKTAFIFQTRLDFRDLLKNILRDLEVPINEKEENISSFLLEFRRHLNERLNRDETVTIIIDEAQSLDDEVLRDLARLSSPAPPATKSPQIVLVGHPELEVRLNSGKLRPLKEQVAVHREIRRLTREETRKYIKHRLKIVGADISEVFTPEAVNRVWEFSEGIPRVINLLCDRALLNGYQTSSPIIDSKIAKETIKDISSPQPRKSGIFREVFNQVRFHYKIIGILFIFLGGLGFFSLFPRDSSLSILKVMVNLFPSTERPMGTGGNILPSGGQPIMKKGTIPISEERPPEKREGEIIEVKKGWNLSLLALHYYPVVNTSLLDFILEANPEITDSNLIFPYQKIKIPKIIEESLLIKGSDNNYNIHLGTFDSTPDVHVYKDEPLLRGKKLTVVPRRVSPRETWYRIVLGGFSTKEEGLKTIQALKEKRLLPLLDCLPKKPS